MSGQYQEEYIIEENDSGKKGCLWGCLGCGGFILFILLLTGYYFYNKILPDEPLPAGTFSATEDEIASMKARLEEIKATPKEGEAKGVNLALPEKELNIIGLIAMENQPEIKVFDATIDGDIITARISVKMAEDKERYLNISYKGTFSLTESSIDMRPEALQFGSYEFSGLMSKAEGQSPAEMESQIRGELAKIRYEHGVIVKELSVKDGKFYINVEKDPAFVERKK